MYRLLVYYPGETWVHESHQARTGAEVLALISKLLAEHDGCERIVVMLDETRLFSVDCSGNRMP